MISLVLFVSSFPLPLHLLNCAFVLPILLPSHSGEGVGSEVLCGCLAAGQGLYTTHGATKSKSGTVQETLHPVRQKDLASL